MRLLFLVGNFIKKKQCATVIISYKDALYMWVLYERQTFAQDSRLLVG